MVSMVSLSDVLTETPTPSPAWLRLSDQERLALVNRALLAKTAAAGLIAVIAAKQDGQIIVSLAGSPADKRGTLLLDFEASLKKAIDPALVVWLEPLGDKSSLRNLRGIEVKS